MGSPNKTTPDSHTGRQTDRQTKTQYLFWWSTYSSLSPAGHQTRRSQVRSPPRFDAPRDLPGTAACRDLGCSHQSAEHCMYAFVYVYICMCMVVYAYERQLECICREVCICICINVQVAPKRVEHHVICCMYVTSHTVFLCVYYIYICTYMYMYCCTYDCEYMHACRSWHMHAMHTSILLASYFEKEKK
jgi:hypothetical protein